MKDTSYRQMVKVSALPTPSAILEGVTVELATDKKPWYCDGTTWYDLTATSAGGGGTGATTQPQVFIQNTQPADTGTPYLWIETGLPDNGVRFWYNENGVV